MKVGDIVICAYADLGKHKALTTGAEYVVSTTFEDGDVGVVTNTPANSYRGKFAAGRFMVKTDMIKQVLENARND